MGLTVHFHLPLLDRIEGSLLRQGREMPPG